MCLWKRGCVCLWDVWSAVPLRNSCLYQSCKLRLACVCACVNKRTNMSSLFAFPCFHVYVRLSGCVVCTVLYILFCHIWTIKQDMRFRTNILLSPSPYFSLGADCFTSIQLYMLESQWWETAARSKLLQSLKPCCLWRWVKDGSGTTQSVATFKATLVQTLGKLLPSTNKI